jgi:hypothetical protein
MERVTQAELARRVNGARALLGKLTSAAQAARALSRRYGVSRMQAYRYLRRARQARDVLPIPERTEVFTVKLPMGLVRRLRKLARSSEETLSSIVARALGAFLLREERG